MKIVALIAFILAAFGDFVPGAGPLAGLLAGAMAVWAMPGAVWMSFSAITYNILAAAFPAPGFIIGDLVADKTPLAEGMAEEIVAAGGTAPLEANYWLVAVHIGLLLYGLKRYVDRAAGAPSGEAGVEL